MPKMAAQSKFRATEWPLEYRAKPCKWMKNTKVSEETGVMVTNWGSLSKHRNRSHKAPDQYIYL